MPRPKRLLAKTAEITSHPPDELSESQTIARIVKATGNNLYSVTLPSGENILVELPGKFRNLVWLRRGGFVLVDSAGENIDTTRDNKIWGEIVNVVRDEKEWRKEAYWPQEFEKKDTGDDKDDNDAVGKLPLSDDEAENVGA
jgi:probable RNA-binding protein EIF1AD